MGNSVCRVCLVSNNRMLYIDDARLLEMYEKLTNTKLNTQGTCMPSTVCYVCHWQLQRCYTFYHLAHKSNRFLQDLMQNGPEATPDTFTTLSPETHNLSVCPTQHMSLNIYSNTTSTPDTVKEEQVVVKEESDITEDIYTEEMTLETSVTSSSDENVEGVISENSELTPDNDDNLNDPNTMHLCFYCDECNTRVSSKHELKEHMEAHTVEKPYSCNRCDMAFDCKRFLIIHMRIHTGEKPYSCNRCDMAFNQKGNLTMHMRVHTGEKPYSCNICDKAFIRKSVLTNHMRVHTGEKPFSCNRCDKAFKQKISLRIHMRVHTGEKPY